MTNKPRIGLIQPGGIGDIIIALPIGKFYFDHGFEIYYPINKNYMDSFVSAAPYINFIALEDTKTLDDAILRPREILTHLNCSRIFNLISYINFKQELLENKKLSEFLKFDQYKYAVTGVPFKNKWNLTINRDYERELNMFNILNLNPEEEYSICHLEGSNFKIDAHQINNIVKGEKLIQIRNLSTNVFDWLTLIERAKNIIMVDSCYANLVDQLNLTNPKTLILRSSIGFTPVFANNWNYTYLDI